MRDSSPAFVMPHYSDDFSQTKQWLVEAVESIFLQTNRKWILIIVDDGSPSKKARHYLEALQVKDDRVKVLFSKENNGPGYCRNVAISFAEKIDSPYILFNDADDVSHIKRVEITSEIFLEDENIDVVYSAFLPIDGIGKSVEISELTPSVREILESHVSPPSGMNAWQQMATVTGYANMTSATSVRLDLARQVKFPDYRISEDYHTWLRYSAQGGYFYFTPDVPSKYRVTRSLEGSTSRGRHRTSFYSEKARVDTEGVKEAIRISIGKGEIDEDEGKKILTCFYIRLAETLQKEGMDNLARNVIRLAVEVSRSSAEKAIEDNKHLRSRVSLWKDYFH